MADSTRETPGWVVTAHLLAHPVVTLLYGTLGDLYGRTRVLQIGAFLVLIGSALCSLSRTMTALVATHALRASWFASTVVA